MKQPTADLPRRQPRRHYALEIARVAAERGETVGGLMARLKQKHGHASNRDLGTFLADRGFNPDDFKD